jgi:hypothetical protein
MENPQNKATKEAKRTTNVLLLFLQLLSRSLARLDLAYLVQRKVSRIWCSSWCRKVSEKARAAPQATGRLFRFKQLEGNKRWRVKFLEVFFFLSHFFSLFRCSLSSAACGNQKEGSDRQIRLSRLRLWKE